MAKLDIFNREWIDVVFAARNQSYGAYQLRKDNDKTTNIAMVIGAALFILVMSAPLISRHLRGADSSYNPLVQDYTDVVLTPPAAVDQEIKPPVLATEPPRSRISQIKYPPLVVVPASEVGTDEPPTFEELSKADPGQKTIAGDPGASIIIDQPVGIAPQKNASVIEDEAVYETTEIEQMPDFPGGISKFYNYVSKNYAYPVAAREQGISGRLMISFVVEKDGSLTDIKILRDLGMGTGEEAVRMLKKAPKWNPGIQNGRAVRVQFNIPIMLSLGE